MRAVAVFVALVFRLGLPARPDFVDTGHRRRRGADLVLCGGGSAASTLAPAVLLLTRLGLLGAARAARPPRKSSGR